MTGRPMDRDVARRIRLVIFDVDGVLTDAGVYLGAGEGGSPIELKRFDIQDGIGVKMLQWSGLDVAWVSGRFSEATSIRARELGVDECHQEPNAYKLGVVRRLMERKNVSWDEVAMVADDIPDLSVFEQVGLRAAVGNATPAVARVAHWQAERRGGHGAVREFCEALLDARGALDAVIERYVQERRREA